MLNLPPSMISILAAFAPLFSRPVFKSALLLITGHFLCTGARTITNLLRCLGFSKEKKFAKFFYVLNKAKWSSFLASKILFLMIVNRLLHKNCTIEINIDTHLTRRRGPKIKGLGKHRDAVASSKGQKVLAIGHNWLVAAIRVPIFGSKYKWSLPFLSYLLTPEKTLTSSKNEADLKGKKRHKKMTKVTCQIIMQIRRWLGPHRSITVVADSAFACREICKIAKKYNASFCSQLRLDASLHDFPPLKEKKERGRPRVVGKRLPNLEELANDKKQNWVQLTIPWYGGKPKVMHVLTDTAIWYHSSSFGIPIRWVITKDPKSDSKPMAIFSTDLQMSVEDIMKNFIERWPIETLFQELNEHLGIDRIHTWSDKSVNRTAPAIIGSYSIACLIVNQAIKDTGIELIPEETAWYKKETVTFSDVIAYLRIMILNRKHFTQSSKRSKCRKKDINDDYCRVRASA